MDDCFRNSFVDLLCMVYIVCYEEGSAVDGRLCVPIMSGTPGVRRLPDGHNKCAVSLRRRVEELLCWIREHEALPVQRYTKFGTPEQKNETRLARMLSRLIIGGIALLDDDLYESLSQLRSALAMRKWVLMCVPAKRKAVKMQRAETLRASFAPLVLSMLVSMFCGLRGCRICRLI